MIPSFFCRLQLPSGPPTVCVIAGDDAAPEVMSPTVEILRLLAPDIRFVEALSGREAQVHYGDAFPDDTREKIDAADCTLFLRERWPEQACLMVSPLGQRDVCECATGPMVSGLS